MRNSMEAEELFETHSQDRPCRWCGGGCREMLETLDYLWTWVPMDTSVQLPPTLGDNYTAKQNLTARSTATGDRAPSLSFPQGPSPDTPASAVYLARANPPPFLGWLPKRYGPTLDALFYVYEDPVFQYVSCTSFPSDCCGRRLPLVRNSVRAAYFDRPQIQSPVELLPRGKQGRGGVAGRALGGEGPEHGRGMGESGRRAVARCWFLY